MATNGTNAHRPWSSRLIYRLGRLPDAVWAPCVSFILLALIGAFGLAASQPWIFPSLGPTAFLQTQSPRLNTARVYHVLVGHFVGIGAGYAAVYMLGVNSAPGVLATLELTRERVFAGALAVFLTMLAGILLKATHPPAAATTLIIALGGFKGAKGVAALIAGIFLLAMLGDLVRALRVAGQKAVKAAEAQRLPLPPDGAEAPPGT